MKVSEYLFNYLEKKDNNQVFGVIGTVAIWIFKALSNNNSIHSVFCNHEQAAVMAADGWSRVSHKPGVVLTTNGPGVTNALTGIAQAWTDSVPLILISGNSKRSVLEFEKENGMRQYGAQDIPIEEMIKPITKGYYLVENPDDFPEILDVAYYLSMDGRPGPVCIDIPLDVQNAEIKDGKNRLNVFETVSHKENILEKNQVKNAVDSIISDVSKSKRPLILAGQGIRIANAVSELQMVSKQLGIPVVTSRMGNDVMLSDDGYFIGRPGQYGNRASHFALQTCDLLLVLGSRLSLNTTGYDPEKFAPQAKKIVVDIDMTEKKKLGLVIDCFYSFDLSIVLPELLSSCNNKCKNDHSEWISLCGEWKKKYPIIDEAYKSAAPLSTYYVIDKLSEYVGEDSVILSDTGTCCNVVSQVWNVKHGQRLLLSGGLSCMGFWATGIGAAISNEGKDTICIVGDGSLQMNIQELSTVVKNNIALKLFVINNNGYQIIKIGQKNYGMEQLVAVNPETGLSFPDCGRIASAYGIQYFCIKTIEDVKRYIPDILRFKGPVLCEVIVDEDQITIPKLKSKANSDGTFVSPDYADLYPFLEEKVLLDELSKAEGV